MKKYSKFLVFFYAMLIGVMSMNLAACGDDDDDNANSSGSNSAANPQGDNLKEKLQGTWTVDVLKSVVMGQTIEMNRDELIANSGYDDFYDDVLTFNGTKVNGLDYQINGNKILLPWYSDLGWWMSVSFSGNKMTLYLDITYEGVPMKLWVTYAKNGSRATFDPSSNASISILDAYMKSMQFLYQANHKYQIDQRMGVFFLSKNTHFFDP